MYNVTIFFKKPHIPCEMIKGIQATSKHEAFRIALKECGNLPYFKSRTVIKEVNDA